MITEFMDVLRDESRSILFSSHNTVDVERISDRITFLDRGRLVASSDKEVFLERWRRIEVQLPQGATLPELPHIVGRASDGHFHTLTTNQFSELQIARLGSAVRHVHRMNLEEIFVANVMHHRESRP
jgi:ABC-2 type transport system ATP-binding protein